MKGNGYPVLYSHDGHGQDGLDHLLVPELRLLGGSLGGCGGLEQLGLPLRIIREFCLGGIPQKSQVFHSGEENITDENTCTATRCSKDYQQESNQNRGIMSPSIIKARMPLLV